MNLYLVNGFLGSGKTTAIANACKQLINQNRRTAVITNDQGSQQVDSAYIQSLSIPGGEVVNGCFCCRYDELEEAVASLKISAGLEIIFAESVGSCTDLVATVAKPFTLYNSGARVVISIFADACIVQNVLNGKSVLENAVQYIYRKQLEEADIIIVNKIDLLDENELTAVKELMNTSYPGKKIIYQNSYNENDIHQWIDLLHNFPVPAHRNSMQLDYDEYGKGESLLAWLDQKLSIDTYQPTAIETALQLTETIYKKIQQAKYAIGHLKFFLSNDEWNKKISYTAIGMRDTAIAGAPSSHRLDILINARVQTSPHQLQQIVKMSIEETMMKTGCIIANKQFSSFSPGYPKPLHRMA